MENMIFLSNFLALETPREHAVFLNGFPLFAGVGKLGVCRRFSNHIMLKVNTCKHDVRLQFSYA